MATRAQLIFLGTLLVLVVAALLWVFVSLPDAQASGVYEPAVSEPEPEPVPPLPPPALLQEDEDPPVVYPLYLVLDDAGHTLEDLRRFFPFSGTFTVAVLPGLADSVESARVSRALGHQVILHQPMEPLSDLDPGPGAIYLGDSEEVVRQVLARNLASLGPVAGVNNHMGSRVTADPETMRTVLRFLQEQQVFFLDSRTTPESVVEEVARELDIPVLVRHVFLDNHRTREAIRDQLLIALDIARNNGEVLMIGHVTSPELAEVLLEMEGEIIRQGFSFRPLTEALQRRGADADSRN